MRGAYSLIILSEGRIIALRDAHGFHPLAMGKVDDAYVFASETCAFDLLEAEYLREVLPGEMVVVDGDKVVSRPLNNAGKVPVRQCIFELVYFARPDSIVFGEDVYQCRKHMGYEMAKEAPTDAELVMPFPDSGVYAAIGFAHAAGVPYEQAYICLLYTSGAEGYPPTGAGHCREWGKAPLDCDKRTTNALPPRALSTDHNKGRRSGRKA